MFTAHKTLLEATVLTEFAASQTTSQLNLSILAQNIAT